jgi:hypothetical protein
MLRLFVLLTGFVLSSPAYAHLGHVGELAGHAHWVGLGAVIVAGALAAAIGKLTDRASDEDENEEEIELGEETPVEG